MDLGEPPFDPHRLAVRTGGHVTARQHASQYVRRRLELGTQDIGESAFAGFDDGAGVMGDQPAQHGIGVPGVAQVPGAIELMQVREGKAGRVADVVQPGGGFQQAGVRTENERQAARSGGDAPGVRPAAGQGLLQECLGQLFGPGSQRGHAVQARHLRRDVHRRGMPSEDVLLSIRCRGVVGFLCDSLKPLADRRSPFPGLRLTELTMLIG